VSYQLAARDLDVFDGAQQSPVDDPFATVLGESPALQEAIRVARRVASRGGANILLCGETVRARRCSRAASTTRGSVPPRPSWP
jgi:transcriptional regulator with AAA-type ATPase domain